MAAAPRKPAGYSGTPLIQKLGIKLGHAVVLLGDDGAIEEAIGPLAEIASQRTQLPKRGRSVDVVILRVKNAAELARRFPGAMNALKADGALWVSWPKKSSGIDTDITENTIRDTALAAGLVDNKVCAITDVWSGLRLVVPVKHRPAWDAAPSRRTPTTRKVRP